MSAARRIGGDWVENVDPGSGRVYYANLKTQETSWTWPDDIPRSEDDAVESNPADWNERLDEASGRIYYFNRVTQETSWTKPAGYKGVGEGDEDPSQVKANWQAREDPSSGHTYYTNSVTMETTWNRPACMDQDDGGAPNMTGAAEEPTTAEEQSENMIDAIGRLTVDETGKDSVAEGSSDAGANLDKASSARHAAGGMPRDDHVNVDAHALLKMVTDKVSTEELVSQIGDKEFVAYAEKNFNYDRKGIFGMKTTTEKITSWKGGRDLIKTSLITLHDKNLQGEAVQCFRNVTGFMGDRNTNKTNMDHAYKLLNCMLVSIEDLRNEIYCQICKQTKGNPSTESTLAGWQLMILCLASFPPGKLLKDYLMAYCAENIRDESQPQVKQYAEFALHCVPRITELGPRRELPTVVEMEACKRLQPATVRVNFLDGKYIMMPVDSWTTAELFKEMICLRLGINTMKPFAIFEETSNEEERVLDPEERILDLAAYWTRLQNEERSKKGKGGEIEEYKFVFKVRLFLEVEQTDLAAVEVMYIQASHDVVESRYPCTPQDSVTLAALQVQEEYGDHPGGECTYLSGKIGKYLASKYLEETDDESELETQVLKLYQRLHGYSQQEARLSYLDVVKSWKIYGSSYYYVEPQNNRAFPHEVVLAINAKGVLVVDPDTKEYVQEFPYGQVVTWGHSPNSFVIVTGNVVRQTKVYFKTDQGKEMNSIVRAYVEHLMANKDTSEADS